MQEDCLINILYQTIVLILKRMELCYCWAINQNWICSIRKVLKTMASNTAWHVNLSSMSNALLHTLSCTPGSLSWYSMSTPLICYILIYKSRSRSNLPKSLLLIRTLQASVKSSYHNKKGLNNWNIRRYKIVWKLLYTFRHFSTLNWTTWMPFLFNLHKIVLYVYSN